MRPFLILALLAAAAGCKEEPYKPLSAMDRLELGNLSAEDLRRVTGTFPGMSDACIEKVRRDGIEAVPERTEDCFVMTPQQRWTGLWRNSFEGSRFCADEPARRATTCGYVEGQRSIWFTPKKYYEPDGALYRVEFDGRRTAVEGMHGHFGMFEHEMVVDRMISMKQVEAPPKE